MYLPSAFGRTRAVALAQCARGGARTRATPWKAREPTTEKSRKTAGVPPVSPAATASTDTASMTSGRPAIRKAKRWRYAASKAALLSLVKSLAIELAPDGVRVNAIVPGSIEGNMIPQERWPELAARIPLGRLGTPDEIADAVRYLCSDEARYITGHAMDVNGGTWMS